VGIIGTKSLAPDKTGHPKEYLMPHKPRDLPDAWFLFFCYSLAEQGFPDKKALFL
jgi:hypothetical protein